MPHLGINPFRLVMLVCLVKRQSLLKQIGSLFVVHALWSSAPILMHARQKCTLIFYFGIPFCQGSAAFNVQPTVLSFIVHFRASSRPTISRDAKTLKVHKNMQLAICFAFRFSAFQSFRSSRRSRQRVGGSFLALGMKIASHKAALKSI
jgi:hypothetical protein